ncbi:SH3 domain-containing protein [Proteiniclasticum sp. SCR006]|uniref:SH3 domain-containing protein n=1 Tax=Proteiniclasticum aestuarii TaxID=2817862 RepID=A0A939HCK5_9CLOT|nr:SH3 domain-containing protein [Proteiniclasticum aestuarii]MBO1265953.1 SH3 domain-containing protein [Proteiniclasticum aestuarii]
MLSKRAKKVLLHTSIALVMSLSATALPMGRIDTVVEAAVINTQAGNLTVTAYSLWAYSGPDWNAKTRTYSKGTTLQVTEKHAVDGKEMYKLSNGLYISANPSYVSFSASAAAAPSAPSTTTDKRETTANLNMRSGAGLSNSILLTIPKGTTLTVQSVSGSWAKVSYSGKTGYVSTNYLRSVTSSTPAPSQPDNTAPESGTDIRKTTANLNMRSGAGTHNRILLTIPRNTTVTVLSQSGGWAKVTYGGKTGYVSTSYLTVVSPTTPEPTPTPDPPAGAVDDVRQTTANLNFRSASSITSSVLSVIPKGTKLTVQSVSGTWAKVTYGGKTGYVSTNYLSKVSTSTPDPTPTPEPSSDIRETIENLNMRSSGSISATILLTIPKGSKVTVLSESGGWAKLIYNGRTGYSSAAYLRKLAVDPTPTPDPTPDPTPTPTPDPTPDPTPTPTPDPTPDPTPEPEPTPEPAPEEPVIVNSKMIITGNLNMRAEPDGTSTVLTVLPKGTIVTVESFTGKWGKLTYNGYVGYASQNYMSPYDEPEVEVPAGEDIRENTYNLNLRSGPGTNYGIILTIPKGTKLTIEKIDGNWAQVTYSGRTGYVSIDYLTKVSGPDTPPETEEPSASDSIIKIEGLSGTLDYADVTVKGYVLTNDSVKQVDVIINGVTIGIAEINMKRDDILASNPEFANAGTSGFRLIVGKDRFVSGTNQVTTSAKMADGSTVKTTASFTYNRPTIETAGKLDHMDVVNYKNEDILVSGYGKFNTGVKNVRVYLNGRAQGTAQYGISRADDENLNTGFEYLIRRNNLFPGKNTIKVEVNGNSGEKLTYTKEINVEKIPTIVVDAGHGGKDSGARGNLNGINVYEKTYVLQYALALDAELKNAGFKTILTRGNDTFIELSDRARIANEAHADLFFSIHHDYSSNSSSQGAFVIYPSYKVSSISESSIRESIDAAGYVKQSFISMGFRNRRDGTDQSISGHTLAVLRQTEMRSVLTEIGYMSNAEDLSKIIDPVFQKAMAKSLAAQIKAYFGM